MSAPPRLPGGDGRPALLTAAEAAKILRVHPRTLNRWATEGRVPVIVTPGGGHRFRAVDIDALLQPRVVTPRVAR